MAFMFSVNFLLPPGKRHPVRRDVCSKLRTADSSAYSMTRICRGFLFHMLISASAALYGAVGVIILRRAVRPRLPRLPAPAVLPKPRQQPAVRGSSICLSGPWIGPNGSLTLPQSFLRRAPNRCCPLLTKPEFSGSFCNFMFSCRLTNARVATGRQLRRYLGLSHRHVRRAQRLVVRWPRSASRVSSSP
jgi:hypothetical protein